DAFGQLKLKETKVEYEKFLQNFSGNLQMHDNEQAKKQIVETVNRIIDGEISQDEVTTVKTVEDEEDNTAFLDPDYFASNLYEECLAYLEAHFTQDEIEELKTYNESPFKNHLDNNNQSEIYQTIVDRFRNV